MTIYTGAQVTVNDILGSKIHVNFNNHDGNIGLVFQGGPGEVATAGISYGAALHLIDALQMAVDLRNRARERKES